MSTIFAKASGQGRCGVSVFRLSGPQSGAALRALTGKIGEPRYARRVKVRRDDGSLIDDGLALWFPAPGSFTGEDVAELHLHGSPAAERQLIKALIALGLEPAGPGAFTMRAFANGKMDLTQAEGLADLLDAETELQHRQAMSHYTGALRERAEVWRRDLIEALAKLDASVDFPDEEDVPAAIASGALPAVERVRGALREIVQQTERAGRIASGVTVAFVGPPNAGKSSLFNKMVESERALVSDEAGTTRDIVSETVALAEHRVTFMDMAGVRSQSDSKVELAGIELARRAAEEADVRLLCFPAGSGPLPDWMAALERPGDLVIRTKDDSEADAAEGVSVLDVQSLQRLRSRVVDRLNRIASVGLAPSERQAHLIERACDELGAFEEQADLAPELAAETVRSAATRLEELTGRIAPDDILDDIFSSFCIGK